MASEGPPWPWATAHTFSPSPSLLSSILPIGQHQTQLPIVSTTAMINLPHTAVSISSLSPSSSLPLLSSLSAVGGHQTQLPSLVSTTMASLPQTTALVPSASHSSLPAGWHHTQQPSLIATTVLLLVLTNSAILSRIYLRSKTQKRLSSDDWILLLSLFLSNGLLSANFVAIKAGLGLHATRVLAEDPRPPNKFIIQAKVAWTNSVLIPPTLFCAKISVLLLLRRIFSSSSMKKSSLISSKLSLSESEAEKELEKAYKAASSKWQRQSNSRWLKLIWWLNVAYSICMAIATTIIFICQVRPISFYWNELFWILKISAPMAHPKHVHIIKHPYPGTGIPEVVNDFAIVFMTMTACWNVRSKFTSAQKVALVFVFILSLFASSCGIPKIIYSYKARPDNDFSWNASNVIVWACCQVGVTQILACLSTISSDLTFLHADRKGYLTNLWPPHPPHLRMSDVFHHFNVGSFSRRASIDADSNRASSSQHLSASASGKKKRKSKKTLTHQPSLGSDFEWVTPPRSVAQSNRASLSSNASFCLDPAVPAHGNTNSTTNTARQMVGGQSGVLTRSGIEYSYFDDLTTVAPSTAPDTRNASLGTRGSADYGIATQPTYPVHDAHYYPAQI